MFLEGWNLLQCRMRCHEACLWICLLNAILPYALAIDCFRCTSLNGELKECEDQFVVDLTTEPFIARQCYYGFFRANFCVKLKGIREDGTSILVRQCAFRNWGRHCGLIQFQGDKGLEDINGCLETCNFDGCNTSSVTSLTMHVFYFSVIGSIFGWFR